MGGPSSNVVLRAGVRRAGDSARRRTAATKDELYLPPFHFFHKAGQRADSLFVESGAKLTPRQYVLLLVLQQRGQASQSNLIRLTGIDRSTMTDMIARLLAQGHLQRRRSSADARAYSVRLTEKGREALKASHSAAEQVNAHLLQPLSADNRARFFG
jgi:DNA-binding MarR family transcriptional regulator